MSTELLEAKRELYHQILKIPAHRITSDEVEIGFLLMKDPEIQALLEKRIEAERSKETTQ